MTKAVTLFSYFQATFLSLSGRPLDVLNRSSRFAAIRIATGLQHFQIGRFESQGHKPFESLFRLRFSFTFKIGFTSRASIRKRFRIARSVIWIARFETSKGRSPESLFCYFELFGGSGPLGPFASRLSFPATEPPDPREFLKGFRRGL